MPYKRETNNIVRLKWKWDFNAQKMKFSIKDFFSKCDQIWPDLVTFTEEILNGKFHFLCSV